MSIMKGHCKTHWLLWGSECVCWCDGTSMDVHEQASQNGLQVKCLCGALWSSPVDFRPKMLEPQKSISTISSLGLFSSRYYRMLQTVGLDCYLLLDRAHWTYICGKFVYIYTETLTFQELSCEFGTWIFWFFHTLVQLLLMKFQTVHYNRICFLEYSSRPWFMIHVR
jgi:hypothetical protein